MTMDLIQFAEKLYLMGRRTGKNPDHAFLDMCMDLSKHILLRSYTNNQIASIQDVKDLDYIRSSEEFKEKVELEFVTIAAQIS